MQAFALFLVWPLAAVLFAAINYRSPWAKNIIWLFCGFFGFTFVIPGEGPDAHRYREKFLAISEAKLSASDYFQRVQNGEFGRGDYLEPTISYLLGLITTDYRVLFAAYGVIFGFFFSRNIWFLMDHVHDRLRNHALPILIMFILLVPIWQINGFRFWTATHIFFFAAIQLVYMSNTKSGYLFLILSILTHISFILPAILLLVFHRMPKNANFFMLLILLSTLFLRIDLEWLLNRLPLDLVAQYFPSFTTYLEEEYAQKRAKAAEATRWFVRFQTLALIVFTILSAILVVGIQRQRIASKASLNLLYLGLLIFSVTTILNVIPSMGRFYTLSFLLTFGSLFVMAQEHQWSRQLQWAALTTYGFIMLPVLIQLRNAIDFTGLATLFCPPLLAWALENTDALAHFYKG